MSSSSGPKPIRAIYTEPDLEEWKKSQSYRDLTQFVRVCGDSVEGKKISDARAIEPSPVSQSDVYKQCYTTHAFKSCLTSSASSSYVCVVYLLSSVFLGDSPIEQVFGGCEHMD